MTSVGITLIGGGIGSWLFGWIGLQVERRWERLDPGDVPLTSAQQFALARQRAVVRQGPFFRRVGTAAIVVGLVFVAIGLAMTP